MRRQLGGEFDAFLACYESEGYAGLRVNTQKITVDDFLRRTPFHLTPVPWTENGFYYRKDEPVTRHPHFFAGLYYIQEPSAMLPAAILPAGPGDRVLDLCAAPGGKATELSARMKGKGLLVANDVSASRAKALLKNLEVWGAGNACVTGETPQRLLEAFGCFFDRILVDAPCSGEGMFRRDQGLIRAWEQRGPEVYARLQKEILACAVQMLKPGGFLVYSTCTFSEQEDEEVITSVLEQFPELELCRVGGPEGFAAGKAPLEYCVRLWPHRIRGEGHFAALLHRRGVAGPDGDLREEPCRLQPESLPQAVGEFLELLPDGLWRDRRYRQIGEQCLLLPPYDLPGRLRYLRTGLLAGTLNRGRFEPSQALAMCLDAHSFPNAADFPSEDGRVIRYLKGETIDLTGDESAALDKGWVLVCADGRALGWGRYADGRIKNKYYPGWRLQG